MQKRTQAITIVVIIAAVLGSAFFVNLYYIRDDSGGQLLWKADEAYLFVGETRSGYQLRMLEYPLVAFKEWLNAPPSPNDRSFLVTVIRVTPSGIERQVGKVTARGEMPDFFRPIGEAIFAKCKGILCKLVGDRFEKATPEEEQMLDGISNLASDIDTRTGLINPANRRLPVRFRTSKAWRRTLLKDHGSTAVLSCPLIPRGYVSH
jgi:hypothetical protein